MFSLWQQICWLYHHPESCHGGNHWLENLISLSVAVYISKVKNQEIFFLSIKTLRRTRSQILFDGGHEERSAGYHFLILERLIELGCFLKYSIKLVLNG